MKKCPFCAEEIQGEAVKCRYCGEFIDDSYKPKATVKWYYSTWAVVVGLLCLGPLALPLIWINPRYNIITKIIITIIVIAATVMFCQIVVIMYQRLIKQINELGLQ